MQWFGPAVEVLQVQPLILAAPLVEEHRGDTALSGDDVIVIGTVFQRRAYFLLSPQEIQVPHFDNVADALRARGRA